MKRTLFIISASLCGTLCFAQLKVYQNGNVGIGSTLTTTDSHLNIGEISSSPSSTIMIIHDGSIEKSSNESFEIPSGAILEMDYGIIE